MQIYRELEPWQINNANLTVYRVMFEHISVQNTNKISYDSLSNLTSYWNERIACQRNIHSVNLWNCEGLETKNFVRYV